MGLRFRRSIRAVSDPEYDRATPNRAPVVADLGRGGSRLLLHRISLSSDGSPHRRIIGGLFLLFLTMLLGL